MASHQMGDEPFEFIQQRADGKWQVSEKSKSVLRNVHSKIRVVAMAGKHNGIYY